MCHHAGFRWGVAGRAGTHSWLRRAQWWSGRVALSVLCGLCCVFSLSVLLLFLFPLFSVLLNCPYPNPPVSACFFPFSSTPRRGEGRPCGALVAGRSQTITVAKRFYYPDNNTSNFYFLFSKSVNNRQFCVIDFSVIFLSFDSFFILKIGFCS